LPWRTSLDEEVWSDLPADRIVTLTEGTGTKPPER
jgi:hypothetical protein